MWNGQQRRRKSLVGKVNVTLHLLAVELSGVSRCSGTAVGSLIILPFGKG